MSRRSHIGGLNRHRRLGLGLGLLHQGSQLGRLGLRLLLRCSLLGGFDLRSHLYQGRRLQLSLGRRKPCLQLGRLSSLLRCLL